MTGSYSCMTLLSTLIFDSADFATKEAWVKQAAEMGERSLLVLRREIASMLAGDFQPRYLPWLRLLR